MPPQPTPGQPDAVELTKTGAVKWVPSRRRQAAAASPPAHSAPSPACHPLPPPRSQWGGADDDGASVATNTSVDDSSVGPPGSCRGCTPPVDADGERIWAPPAASGKYVPPSARRQAQQQPSAAPLQPHRPPGMGHVRELQGPAALPSPQRCPLPRHPPPPQQPQQQQQLSPPQPAAAPPPQPQPPLPPHAQPPPGLPWPCAHPHHGMPPPPMAPPRYAEPMSTPQYPDSMQDFVDSACRETGGEAAVAAQRAAAHKELDSRLAGWDLKVYGSVVQGTETPLSDADFAVTLPPEFSALSPFSAGQPPADWQLRVVELLQVDCTGSPFKSPDYRPWLVRVAYQPAQDSPSILVDISAVSTAGQTDEIIKLMLQDAPRIRHFVQLVKIWARRRGLCDAKDGYPNSVTWTMLAMHYCQRQGLLPLLLKAGDGAKPATPVQPPSDFAGLMQLLYGFFQWLSGLATASGWVTLEHRELQSEPAPSSTAVLKVRDPADSGNNLAKATTEEKWAQVRASLVDSARYCRAACWRRIFDPHDQAECAPPGPAPPGPPPPPWAATPPWPSQAAAMAWHAQQYMNWWCMQQWQWRAGLEHYWQHQRQATAAAAAGWPPAAPASNTETETRWSAPRPREEADAEPEPCGCQCGSAPGPEGTEIALQLDCFDADGVQVQQRDAGITRCYGLQFIDRDEDGSFVWLCRGKPALGYRAIPSQKDLPCCTQHFYDISSVHCDDGSCTLRLALGRHPASCHWSQKQKLESAMLMRLSDSGYKEVCPRLREMAEDARVPVTTGPLSPAQLPPKSPQQAEPPAAPPPAH
eukprot:TRINITY_DN11782_c0_g1_i1.p1 TRINITY_DN11782_c0_g1~~TRINITY_DN11782_c0_g1_i1.p1  ORF type:complete len:885 (+),score=199.43 TRINITY_DN11782_c0_g1_i1:226-2655(+)